MQNILIRAGCFVVIIIIGYVLRRVGVFTEHAFPVLSKLVIKITLPAAIVSGFAGRTIDLSLLSLTLLGLGISILYMILGYLLNRRTGKAQQAASLITLGGYNIGNFTTPFVQSFLGPVGIVTTSLFDTGNACICLGASHGIGSLVASGKRFSVKKVALSLVKSVPFMTYIIVVLLNLLRVNLPSPILSLAEIIGGANAFLAMLMIGVGLKLEANRTQIGQILKVLFVRYGVAVLFALACWFLLPFDVEIRRTLTILAFSPVPSSAPAFIGDIEGDVGLASAINSFSIIISIIAIVSLLIVTV